jgi:hypothetical protein
MLSILTQSDGHFTLPIVPINGFNNSAKDENEKEYKVVDLGGVYFFAKKPLSI